MITVVSTARVSPPVVKYFTGLIIRAVNIAFFNGLKIVLQDLEHDFQKSLVCTLGPRRQARQILAKPGCV